MWNPFKNFWPEFKEVEPIKPLMTESNLKELLKTYEFKQNCRYVLWFPGTLEYKHIVILRSLAKGLGLDKQLLLVSGVKEPKIFELEVEDGNIRSESQHMESHGEGNAAPSARERMGSNAETTVRVKASGWKATNQGQDNQASGQITKQ